MNICNWLL